VLYAKDRGCTKPGCDAPAYHSQVYHVQGWTKTHRTDINDPTLAWGPDNRRVEKGWTTPTPEATPNGSRPRTWIMGNPASTPTTTRRNS
jgi:hypothetical protein